MLRLTRRPGEKIILTVQREFVEGVDPNLSLEIQIVITGVRGKQVELGITAPPDKVRVLRGELAKCDDK